MIGKRKKQPPVQRAPHLSRQKQTTFRYTSNRSQTERKQARQDPKESERVKTAKSVLAHRLKQAPYVIGGLVLLAGAVYFSLLPASPKVIVRGDQLPLRDGAAYTRLTSDVSNNVQSHSKLTINRQKITDQLQAEFPELRTVNVTTPLFGSRAVVELEIARPALLFKSGSDTFVLDNRGTVLLNTAQNQAAIKVDTLPVLTDQSNARIAVGKQALTSGQVAFTLEVNRQSQAKQLTIESINLSAGAGELAVRYAGTPYSVKYNVNEDARKSFGTYIATKEYIERTNVKPTEYIDVRIPERAYIK